ncbi:hypothetical protein A2U01_0098501, partial [Trifolium medium]|nr:hypothetical protein [Trifolium medium]
DYGCENQCTDCGSVGYFSWYCGKGSPTEKGR